MHDECQQLQGLLSLLWAINRMGVKRERVAQRDSVERFTTSRPLVLPQNAPHNQSLFWEWFMHAGLSLASIHGFDRIDSPSIYLPCGHVVLYMHH